MLSADNLCKQLGPRSGSSKCLARSGVKLCVTLMLLILSILMDFPIQIQTIRIELFIMYSKGSQVINKGYFSEAFLFKPRGGHSCGQ